ncbi:hypothetical protein [Bacteroides sedimenti]|uniref:Uncharacterized protein n=1 Tax=Bacteroides sedimenti TaxID=2136147 RepID=A0ABM8IDR1_9BACE
MALPLSNITTQLVASAIGVGSSDIGTLCSHAKIFQWSKRKPIIDTVRVKNTGKYWKTSSVDDRVRNGFWIENDSSSPTYAQTKWDYKRIWNNCPGRIGDFRGYIHGTGRGDVIRTVIPGQLTKGSGYTVNMIARGYENLEGGDDVGLTGLQDVFKLDTKYCCLGFRLKNVTESRTVDKFSAQIPDAQAVLHGAQVDFTASEIDTLIGSGGVITGEIFFVEADSWSAGSGFVNPKRWSLKSEDTVQTTFESRQFLASGFSFVTNYSTQTPAKAGARISNSGSAVVTVNSSNKTGGLVSGYYFRARILDGNQVGTNYTYALPNYTLAANSSYTYVIPNFYLDALDGSFVRVEYSTWRGAPDAQDSELIQSNIFEFR